MKVIHVIGGLDAGGAEGMLLRLVGATPEHAHIVVSLTNLGVLAPAFLSKGIQLHELNIRARLGLLSLWKLWRIIRKTEPDIIQTWMSHSDLLGGIVGRLAGVRNVIWNIRHTDIPQSRFSLTGLVIKLGAVASHWLPKRIVCCAFAALEMHVKLGYCRERMVVIPNGYDIQNFPIPEDTRDSRRHALGLPSMAIVVGVVGRYDPLKGYGIFVRAAGLLAERKSDNVVFVMVGRNVAEANTELRDLIARFGGKATFKLMGERRDVPRIMSVLDIYCLSSNAEGFPNVVAEAMLMQVPCVVTDVGDARRIVGSVGLVVPPGDPDALANALHTLVAMGDEDRGHWGIAARRQIIENYGIEKIAGQYIRLYEEALAD